MVSENGALLYREIKAEVGAEAAQKIFRLLAGQQVYFPCSVLREFTYRRVICDYEGGMSFRDLARKYRVTEKHIRRITARSHRPASKPEPAPTPEPKQKELFPL